MAVKKYSEGSITIEIDEDKCNAMANVSMFAPPMFLNSWTKNQKLHALQTALNAAHAWMHAPQRPSSTIPVKGHLEGEKQVLQGDVLFCISSITFSIYPMSIPINIL